MVKGDVTDADLKREESETRTKTVNIEEERGRTGGIFSSFGLPILKCDRGRSP